MKKIKLNGYYCPIYVIFVVITTFSILLISLVKRDVYAYADSVFTGTDGTLVEAGTSANPYAISTCEQLKQVASLVNNADAVYNSAYYRLTADIILNDGTFDANGNFTPTNGSDAVTSWTPIGNTVSPFYGYFDGNGHTVSGIYINSSTTDRCALFGYISDACIINLGVVNGYICGKQYSAGIAAQSVAGKVINCYNSCYLGINKFTGGIVGYSQGKDETNCSYIINCYNTGSVISTKYGGGIAGYVTSYNVISNNYYLKIIGGTNSGLFDIGYKVNAAPTSDIATDASFTSYESILNIIVGGVAGERTISAALNEGSEYYSALYSMQLLQWSANSTYPEFYVTSSSYMVTYDYATNGGSGATVNYIETDNGSLVDLTPQATKDGWSFVGWNTDSNAVTAINSLTMEAQNITLYAIFCKQFTVHFVDVASTQNQNVVIYNTATSGTITAPEITSADDWQIVGWRDDEEAADKEYSFNSTLSIDCDITFYAVYSTMVILSYDTESGSTPSSQTALQYRNAGGNVSQCEFTLAEGVTRDGYTFDKWVSGMQEYEALSVISFIGSITLSPSWIVNADTAYSVYHYKETLIENAYEISVIQTLTGVTGDYTQAVANAYEGFTAIEFSQTTIEGDGLSFVNIYYKRNSYTLTYKALASDEAAYYAEILDYGQTITPISGTPENIGYTFDGWINLPEIMPASHVMVTASWIADTDTPYLVNHYKESLDNSYELFAVDTLSGITDSITQAMACNYTGFTVDEFYQGVISCDGSTVIEIYYSRESYLLYYKESAESEKAFATVSLKFGATITPLADIPLNVGYSFAYWENIPSTMPSCDVLVIAVWTANSDTEYTVNHYTETLTENSFEIADIEVLTGTTQQATQASAYNYNGFTVTDYSQTMIEGDGSTEVNIYYTRNTYTLTYKLFATDETVYAVGILKFGEVINIEESSPVRIGYQFLEWSDVPYVMPYSDLTVYAEWMPDINIKYTVNHFKENLSGGYPATALNIDYLYGTTDTNTKAVAYKYTGFTVIEFSQKIIEGNGTTEINIYYSRNTYKLSFYALPEDNIPYEIARIKFGGAIIEPVINPVRTGYIFSRWRNLPSTMPACDTVITAYWAGNNDTAYTVNHYLQTTSGVYNTNPDITDILIGTTEEYTIANAYNYTGFTANVFAQCLISGDGLTEIDIYYSRNSYNVTFYSGDTIFQTFIAKYGVEINLPADKPARSGYTFISWSAMPDIIPCDDVEVTSVWELNTPAIITQPLAITTVYSGNINKLTVKANHGLNQLVYKWYKDNNLIDKTLSDSIYLTNVNESGIYFCEISVTDGTQTKTVKSNSVSVKISKATVDMSGVTFTNKKVYYSGKAYEITINGILPNGVLVSYISNEGTEVGFYNALAVFTVGENYNKISNMSATLTIVLEDVIISNSSTEESIDNNYEKEIIIDEDSLISEALEVTVADCKFILNRELLLQLKEISEDNLMKISVQVVDKTALNKNNKELVDDYDVYDLSLIIGEQSIHNLDGSITITLPYTLKTGESAEGISVWYLNEGTLTKMENAVYKDGYATFTVNHFSYYAVGYESNATITQNTLITLGIILGMIIFLIILIFIIHNIRKRARYLIHTN